MPDLYKAYTGKEPVNPKGQLERSEVAELNKALMVADLERRIYEAKEFLKQHDSSQ